MAVIIDVITGFLESGKTTFIHELIESINLKEYEKTVLIVCEEGIEEYTAKSLKEYNISLLTLENYEELTNQWFNHMLEEYDPDYILIEYNGTWNLRGLLGLKMPKHCKLRNLVHIGNAGNFKHYLSNMASILQPQIINSDVVLFNRFDHLSGQEKKRLKSQVKNINPKTEPMFTGDWTKSRLINYFKPYEKYQKITPGMILLAAVLLILCLIPFQILEQIYNQIQSVSTYFLSILLQALPFILLGAFVSAVIQLLVPAAWIMRRFSEQNYSSFFFAAIAGFFVPVCDCGLVPIVSGLLKKETPLPQTMTFWLASAAVNPIVILSVFYAFPDKPWLAAVRAGAGAAIGILAGIILKTAGIKTRDVIKLSSTVNIGSNLLERKHLGARGKIEAVFEAARIEFFRVSKYVIIGALISSLFQSIIPQNFFDSIGDSMVIQMFIMITAAIFMSTCSTSNAFIGRSFAGNFAQLPVMSFIVMGPMLDFKNLIMLSEILKKSFLVKLAALVIAAGLFVFGIIGYYL